MVKVVLGRYLERPLAFDPKWKVLDVGCGSGNNLLPFLARGCVCCGVEIDRSIVESTNRLLRTSQYEADIRIGHNRSIPFSDRWFDLVLSINVIHYETNEEDVFEALREYRRVLRPEGALYIATVAPEHEICRRAARIDAHVYRVENYDFRDGTHQFYFGTRECLERCLSVFFDDVEIGRVTERLMTRTLDFFLAVAR